MRKDLTLKFIETQAIILSPICPHIAEQLWTLLGKSESIMRARWPVVDECDEMLRKESTLLDESIHEFRQRLKLFTAPKGKVRVIWNQSHVIHHLRSKILQSGQSGDPPTHGTIYVASEFPSWQATIMNILRQMLSVIITAYLCIARFLGDRLLLC